MFSWVLVLRQVVTKGKSGMVELVCGPHHVSSGGEKGKFLSGGASAWASPRESKGGGARGWASPWMSWW